MGDEVTKKDLQSLQGYCNKQIADAVKKLEAHLGEEIDKLWQDIMKIHLMRDNLQKRVEALEKK